MTDPVADLVGTMTLPEKVGQLFMTYAYGATAHSTDPADMARNRQLHGVDDAAQLVRRFQLGGIIYFGFAGNLVTPGQIAELSNDLQAVAATTGSRVPLVISTDQEGGKVTRIGAPLAISPGNLAVGAGFDPAAAHDLGRVTGQQLRALGITVVDAPVLDTNTNPGNAAAGSRAFGDRAEQTAGYGAASVRGHQSERVAATAKHFPGLGSTTVNTDHGVAISDRTRAGFEAHDLPAFRAAVAAGVDRVMLAHVVVPALDPSGVPASLSHPVVTGLLRDELGFDGVVVTDALDAKALQAFDNRRLCVDVIRAGGDQLLMPTDLAGSIAVVLAAVRDGTLSEHRIEQSVIRVLRLKRKLGLFASAQVDAASAASRVGTPAQLQVQDAAARRAVTLLRNDGQLLPLPAQPGRVLVTGYGSTATATLAAELRARGVVTTRVVTGSVPAGPVIGEAVSAARDADYVVVVSSDAWADPEQRQLVAALLAEATPVVVVAVGAPYELGFLPRTPVFLACYGYQPPSLRAVVEVLFGAQPQGRLPVTVRSPDGGDVVASWGSGLRYPSAVLPPGR